MEQGISVIVPTYNRSSLLRVTLTSLLFQDANKDSFEVLVVDDGSSDNTKEVVDSFKGNLNIKYFFQEDLGFRVAKARNIGINAARFERCIFIDSGVVASKGLVSAHLEMHAKDPRQVIIGSIIGFKESGESGHSIIPAITCSNDLDVFFDGLTPEDGFEDVREKNLHLLDLSVEEMRSPWILFWTGHASCATKDLRAINGFDEWFKSWGGEDVELALRLHSLGLKFKFLSQEKIFHCYHEKDLGGDQETRLSNSHYVYNKHKEKYDSDGFRMLLEYDMTWMDVEGVIVLA